MWAMAGGSRKAPITPFLRSSWATGSIKKANSVRANHMRKTSIFRRQMKLMGSHFEISAVADEEAHALEWIRAGAEEIQRIEKLLTTYDENSETNQVNRQAGIAPVPVSRETFDLIE